MARHFGMEQWALFIVRPPLLLSLIMRLQRQHRSCIINFYKLLSASMVSRSSCDGLAPSNLPHAWKATLVSREAKAVLFPLALNISFSITRFVPASISSALLQAFRLSIFRTPQPIFCAFSFVNIIESTAFHFSLFTRFCVSVSGAMDAGQRDKGKKPVFTIERGNPPGHQGWPPGMRPLSDIRELTEPSLVDALEKRPSASVHRQPSITRQSSLRRGPSLKRAGSVRIVEPIGSSSSSYREDMMASESTIDTPESLRDGSSLYSIPISSIPARQSSNIRERPRHHRSTTSRSSPTPLQRNASRTIPYRGTSHSPVKQVRARLDAVGSDTSRRVPSGTFIRNPVPRDILEFPTHRHPRIGVDLQIGAPLFVGGGTVEGYVRVIVDEADKARNKKSLTLGRIAVDLVGTEETSSNRKAIFLSLGTELIDSTHPPPRNMVEPQDFPDDDCFWSLIPSFTSLPFVISLPLDTGPPPFHSKHARIRFVLCATVLIKDGGRQYLVRCSEDISVLPTYDRMCIPSGQTSRTQADSPATAEKALRSLPSPLTASDEQSFSRSGLLETAKITAGLHRQVWVSGSSIFVDIHIANGSRKTIKKLELSLERDILCYRHVRPLVR